MMHACIVLKLVWHLGSFLYRAGNAALPLFAAPLFLLMHESWKPAFLFENIFLVAYLIT